MQKKGNNACYFCVKVVNFRVASIIISEEGNVVNKAECISQNKEFQIITLPVY